MLFKQPFARRITLAFTLMTLVVSGIFSIGLIGTVHFVEEYLVSKDLSYQLDTIIDKELKEGLQLRFDAHTYFYADHLPEYPVPKLFQNVKEGFSEIVDGRKAFHIYTRNIEGKRYILVQEQDEFEAREHLLFNIVLAGFLLSVAGAWLLGRLLARRVMAPITRLAQQVRHQDQLRFLAPPLAPAYPNDEIGRLAAAFDSTLGQLRQSLERERLFTSDVSHELRSPLMIISTSCELLENAELAPREKNQIARIQRAAEAMRNLVQTFLILARAKPEEASINEETSLAFVAREQSLYWSEQILNKGVQFELIQEGENTACYNLTFLRTIIANLLRNALHYTDTGTIRLVLETDGFRVEDSGIGIPADQQKRIFEPFLRGAHARGEGLGLGLSLVKRICAYQGWCITVSELTPHGSCFRVAFNKSV